MEAVISLKGISRIYKVLETAKGGFGFIKSLVAPKYRIVKALEDINLDIYEGEVVGYIGPNGAGKSTTIKIIAGVLRPTDGIVEVAGKDPSGDRIAHQLQLGVVLGQRSKLFWDLPVRDSFYYQARVYNVPRSSIQTNVDEAVELFDIGCLLEQPVRQLSLGQRVRCDIALNLVHKPKVLLLDEPTIGLDIDAKLSLRTAIRRASEELKTTILLSSHDLEDVEILANRIVVLNGGKILFNGDQASLRNRYSIRPLVRLSTPASPCQLTQMLSGIAGIAEIGHDGPQVTISYEQSLTSPAEIVSTILKSTEVDDFSLYHPPIEDVIRVVYQNRKKGSLEA